MLAAQATATKYMGLLESPSPRKMELMMLYAVIKGMPIKQMVRYWTVPSTASAGVDMTAAMGRTSASSAAVSTRDTAMNRVTLLPTARAARSCSWPPTARPMVMVAPMASPTIMTVSMCITWLPMDTAVMSAVPLNCPMMNRSAMPYKVCRK